MQSRILSAILQTNWLMNADQLQILTDIATRKNDDVIQMIRKEQGETIRSSHTMEIRGDIAIIPILGPIFPKANIMTELCDATSLETTSINFNKALSSNEVKMIVFEISSPGGSSSGVNEFAEMIYQARGQKPIISYVSDSGSSAAYWIASAADRIVLDETAMVGSVGVVTQISKNTDDDSYQFVSSNAPNKRPDYESDKGKESVQTLIDDLESVFIDKVARNMGTDRAYVLKNFGLGGMKIGQKAIDAGMAHELGSMESVITGMTGDLTKNGGCISTSTNDKIKTEAEMTVKKEDIDQKYISLNFPQIAEAFQVEGAKKERARIEDIDKLHVTGAESLIADAKANGTRPGDLAMQIVGFTQGKKEGVLKNLKAGSDEENGTNQVDAGHFETEEEDLLMKQIDAAVDAEGAE